MAVIQDDNWYLHRLIQRLMIRQRLYQLREDYAVGNHPLPNPDPRFKEALKELQRKAKTNYVGLAIKAVTDRCKVRGFKFAGEIDQDAMRIWRANNMDVNSQIAIGKAAELSDVYALVSPSTDPGGEPIITIEDPRTCIVEPDPLNPLKAICGLKFYEDTVIGKVVAILYFPDRVVTFVGPVREDFLRREQELTPGNISNSSIGFSVVSVQPNPIGVVPLVRGAWTPRYGLRGMAECEDGGWEIQDRINTTVLLRMVIGNSQAFRQRWMTGGTVQLDKNGAVKKTPFEPGAALVWAVADPDANFGDFDQADIRQLLEAIRDDVGDFAAVTQTPVTYLTNKMVNVSGETMTVVQVSLISKAKTKCEAMGWFFEQIMKICFLYKGDPKATDDEAETLWVDPELRTLAEVADFISKAAAAGVSPRLFLEKSGMFTPEEIEIAVQDMEKMRQQQMADQMAMQKQAQANKPAPSGGASSGRSN